MWRWCRAWALGQLGRAVLGRWSSHVGPGAVGFCDFCCVGASSTKLLDLSEELWWAWRRRWSVARFCGVLWTCIGPDGMVWCERAVVAAQWRAGGAARRYARGRVLHAFLLTCFFFAKNIVIS